MKIVHIASEVAPWSQTGGLADVVGAVPHAIQEIGGSAVQCAVITPFYRGIRQLAKKRGVPIEDTEVTVSATLAGWSVVARVFALREASRPPVYLRVRRFFGEEISGAKWRVLSCPVSDI